jgi:hypothetical protein
MKFKSLFTVLLVFISFALAIPVNAADIFYRLTHNDQYSLVLGKVTKVGPTSFEFSSIRVISGHRMPDQIVIMTNGTPQPKKSGEKLLISLERVNDGYRIRWGLFRVSNLDPKKLRIIKSTWPQSDLAALEHYVHTNGAENNFFFVFGSAFVHNSDSTFTRIYPKLPINKRTKHFKLMICPERQNYYLTDSLTPGLGLHAVYYRYYDGIQFRWETNYGQFSLWETPDYRVIPLGRNARIPGWKTVYWTPSLTQKIIPKEIKITVTAEDQKSKTKYEHTYLEIQPKEEGFKVKI